MYKILGLPVNTVTRNDKWSLLITDNLMGPIQMQLSEKKNFFVNFFFVFRM